MLAVSSGFLPILYLVSGVASDTLSGVQSLVVNAGMRRYSPKVLDGVSKYIAIYSLSSLDIPCIIQKRLRFGNLVLTCYTGWRIIEVYLISRLEERRLFL